MVGSHKRFWRASRLPVLALATGAIAVLAYEAYPRRPPPRSVAELVDRLRESGMGVHVVPVNRATKGLEDGAFLCEGERPWEADAVAQARGLDLTASPRSGQELRARQPAESRDRRAAVLPETRNER